MSKSILQIELRLDHNMVTKEKSAKEMTLPYPVSGDDL